MPSGSAQQLHPAGRLLPARGAHVLSSFPMGTVGIGPELVGMVLLPAYVGPHLTAPASLSCSNRLELKAQLNSCSNVPLSDTLTMEVAAMSPARVLVRVC
jgi:hypothetical protein